MLAFLDGPVQFVHDESFCRERFPSVFDVAAHDIGIELGMKLHAITSLGKTNRVVIIEVVLCQHLGTARQRGDRVDMCDAGFEDIGNSVEMGSCEIFSMCLVPISRPRGFFLTSPPSACASIWCPKQMPNVGTPICTTSRRYASVLSIQSARSGTFAAEPVMTNAAASRGSTGASVRASKLEKPPVQASPMVWTIMSPNSPRRSRTFGTGSPVLTMKIFLGFRRVSCSPPIPAQHSATDRSTLMLARTSA